MKNILKFLIYCFILFSLGENVFSQPVTSLPLEVQRIRKAISVYPTKIIRLPQTQEKNTLTFHSGSLKENIQRVAKECGWDIVVWKNPYDYRWIGTTHFIDSYLPGILHKVLKRYPLQAVFYEGNHVLVIIPRNLS